MATLTEHFKAIARQINDLTISTGMPSEIRVATSQHGYLAAKSNGDFIMTVESVPCYVDTGASAATPIYKESGGSDATTSYTEDAGVLF